ncbi:MAG: lipocalin family protein [Desulforhopalus sp.]
MLFFFILFLVTGCAGIPDNIRPVEGFDVRRYMGTWYEIARLDHSFERGMSRVTAEYTLQEDGTVRVVNRGYVDAEKQWKTAEGRGRFGLTSEQGYLQVSFFWPFYGAYVVIALDREDYQYALVCGPSRDYLWILSRKPHLAAETLQRLINRARQLGFPVEHLIFVAQDDR